MGYYSVDGNCGGNDIQTISPGSVQGCALHCNNNTACIGKYVMFEIQYVVGLFPNEKY